MVSIAYPIWSIYEPLFASLVSHDPDEWKTFRLNRVTDEQLCGLVRRQDVDVAFVSVSILPYIKGYRRLAFGGWYKEGGGLPVVAGRDLTLEMLVGHRVGVRDRWAPAYAALGLFVRNVWPVIRSPMNLLEELERKRMDAAVVDYYPVDELRKRGFVVVDDLVMRWMDNKGYPMPLMVGLAREGISPPVLDFLKTQFEQAVSNLTRNETEWIEQVTASVPMLAEFEIRAFVAHTLWTEFRHTTATGQQALIHYFDHAFHQGLLPYPDAAMLERHAA